MSVKQRMHTKIGIRNILVNISIGALYKPLHCGIFRKQLNNKLRVILGHHKNNIVTNA